MSYPHSEAFRSAVLADRGRLSASVCAMKHGVSTSVVSGIWHRAKRSGAVPALAGRFDGSKALALRVSRTRDNAKCGELVIEAVVVPAAQAMPTCRPQPSILGVTRASNGVSLAYVSCLDGQSARGGEARS